MIDQTVLVSRPAKRPAGRSLGTAHYSYGFAAAKFIAMLESYGVQICTIESPEQFKDPLYSALAGFGAEGQVHLIFRSTEDIRTIPGCYNIACFAWEFESMKHDGLPEESILFDQVRMLQTCQEVWVPSNFTQQVLLRHGIQNTRVVPAPITGPTADSPSPADAFEAIKALESVRLVTRSSGREDDFVKLAARYVGPLGSHERVRRAVAGKRVFLTICNPYDQRKNLATLIEGFLMATEGVDDAVLLVKLVTSGMFEVPSGFLYHQLRVIFGNPHCINTDRVILFSGYLDEDEMTALYRSAHFYVCASIAEGQNLPLLEAMAHRCVPVSVRNTAMADYISEESAVVIEERRFSGLRSGLAGHVVATRLTIDFADRFQVANAVRRALSLGDGARDAIRDAAEAAVAEGYHPANVYPKLQPHIRKAGPDLVSKGPRIGAVRFLSGRGRA